MNFTHEEKERAFATYRGLFSGKPLGKKSGKKIREILTNHQKSAGQTTSEGEMTRLVVLIEWLMAKKVFSSTTRAMKMFPLIFKPTTPRMEAREASEASVTRKESEMLDAVDGAHEAGSNQEVSPVQTPVSQPRELEAPGTSSDDIRSSSDDEVTPAPRTARDLSLFPTYLPYETQHLLLKSVQELLEQCCFGFISHWLPGELQKRGWETSNAVELTKWTRLVPNWEPRFPPHAIELNGDESLRPICTRVNKIRHAAVHRLALSANTLESQLQAAIKLTTVLKDEDRTTALTKIAGNFASGVQELEREKTLIEFSFDRELEVIREQRRKLEQAEAYLYESVYQRDSESRAEVGRDIAVSTQQILSGLNSAGEGADSNSKLPKNEGDRASSWTPSLQGLRDGLEALGVRIL